jgi:hypothetical protein
LELDGSGAWGAVLRDDLGGVIMTAWGSIPHCPNAVTTALPVLARPIQVQSDNAFSVNAVKETAKGNSLIADRVQDKDHLGVIPEVP